ncbi:MAG: flagellar protein FliS [Phycisphaerales bacterium]|nr:flagellar protein FliS [Phycisphaerales bacterium]
MRAQKIVLELSTSLKHEVAPDLCTKLTALYNYIYKQLVEATLQRDPNLVKEALTLLEYETQTWRMLMDKLTQEPGDGSTDHAQVTAPQQTAISSLSQNA